MTAPQESDRAAREMLETIAGERCPCGHLGSEHKEPTGAFEGEKWGDCRECDCRGLIAFDDDEEQL